MIKLNNNRYIGEQIADKDISNWEKGDVVTIQAGTGLGKSYFIKNNLYESAAKDNGKILMLIHRRNCVDQFSEEVIRDNKDDVIDIMTYQRIEYLIMRGIGFDFSQYKYIVSDEFHYFLSDANFNHTTDISLERILNQNSITRIFMSATGDYMREYLRNYKNIRTISYEMEPDFSHIDHLEFYTNEDALEQYIEEVIASDEKAIVFIQSATKAYKMYRKYEKHSLFNCGQSDKHYKYVDSQKIRNMLVNERFEEQLLITTTVMDSGVNIHDKKVTKIILDVEDRDVFTQCLGRRRVDRDSDESIDIYVRRISNEQLGGRMTQANDRLKKVRYLREHGSEKYIDMYGRSPDVYGMIYDGKAKNGQLEKRINNLVRIKSEIDIITYKEMVEMSHEDYINEEVLRRESGDYIMKWKEERADNLSEYLESRLGDVMLTVSDRKELIDMINVRRGGKLLRSIDILNKTLEELNVNYRIVAYRTSETIKGKRKWYNAAWKVMKLYG